MPSWYTKPTFPPIPKFTMQDKFGINYSIEPIYISELVQYDDDIDMTFVFKQILYLIKI